MPWKLLRLATAVLSRLAGGRTEGSHLAASSKFSYFGQMDKPLTDAERECFLQSVGMIVQAFEECGIKLVLISPEESRRGKEEDRTEDRRLLASGEMTANQLQERNAFFKGPIKVLDKSASYR
ncbi:MAG: hypothetical protein ABSE62_14110 [Chthoniobacteraceae bacterium]